VSSYSLAVIGASTGGPRAIEAVLRSIGPELTVPVAVVQHMPPGFTRAFAERLDRALPFPVREGAAGETLQPGCVYSAPGGLHMALTDAAEPRLALRGAIDGTVHAPSVDELFVSAAKAYGGKVVAALLTGMGRDGARGMEALVRAGAHTIAQSEDSCVVYGMPRAAVEAGAAREVLPLDRIGPRLRTLLGGNDPHQEN
jgi:two-component system chemotaxis response regulator CheB